MGNIDEAVPFFGKRFNKIYPLIMVIYTVLVASNFFGRVIDFFGSWKWFRFQNEVDDMNGFDPSGLIILQKERSWLEEGRKVGEQVIPLARNFNSTNVDLESGDVPKDRAIVESKATGSLSKDRESGTPSKSHKEDDRRYSSSREALANKYAGIREQKIRHSTSMTPSKEKVISTASVSLLNSQNQPDVSLGSSSSGLASTWASMKTGFQNLKANVGAKKFLPLQQLQETSSVHTRVPSSESLDEIFQKLKHKPSRDQNGNYGYNDIDDA